MPGDLGSIIRALGGAMSPEQEQAFNRYQADRLRSQLAAMDERMANPQQQLMRPGMLSWQAGAPVPMPQEVQNYAAGQAARIGLPMLAAPLVPESLLGALGVMGAAGLGGAWLGEGADPSPTAKDAWLRAAGNAGMSMGGELAGQGVARGIGKLLGLGATEPAQQAVRTAMPSPEPELPRVTVAPSRNVRAELARAPEIPVEGVRDPGAVADDLVTGYLEGPGLERWRPPMAEPQPALAEPVDYSQIAARLGPEMSRIRQEVQGGRNVRAELAPAPQFPEDSGLMDPSRPAPSVEPDWLQQLRATSPTYEQAALIDQLRSSGALGMRTPRAIEVQPPNMDAIMGMSRESVAADPDIDELIASIAASRRRRE